MKPISDPIFDYGKSKFQKANETLSDEGLRNAGVTDTKLAKTLGFFGLVIVLMLILVGVFFLLSWANKLTKRLAWLRKGKDLLAKKLFFNSFLRYMIVSNHKLTYVIWAFFVTSYAMETTTQTLMVIGTSVGILFLLVYPFCTMFFLIKY